LHQHKLDKTLRHLTRSDSPVLVYCDIRSLVWS
jgi:hypothetical protein